MEGILDSNRNVTGVRRTHHTYYPRKNSIFAINIKKKNKIIEDKKNIKSKRTESVNTKKNRYNKNKKHKKNSKAKTIPDSRLTEPKKRSLARRIMLQMKYNHGGFDYIEDEYEDITRQEILESKNAKKKS